MSQTHASRDQINRLAKSREQARDQACTFDAALVRSLCVNFEGYLPQVVALGNFILQHKLKNPHDAIRPERMVSNERQVGSPGIQAMLTSSAANSRPSLTIGRCSFESCRTRPSMRSTTWNFQNHPWDHVRLVRYVGCQDLTHDSATLAPFYIPPTHHAGPCHRLGVSPARSDTHG